MTNVDLTISELNMVNYSKANADLKISIDYSLGGINYWNYQTIKRGIRIRFIPEIKERQEFNGRVYITRKTIIGADTYESGFSIFLKETKRRNDKLSCKYKEAFKPYAEKMTEMFEKQQFEDLKDFVYSIADKVK